MYTLYDRWNDFCSWAEMADLSGDTIIEMTELGAPSPTPRQSLGVGLNYATHAAESGFETPIDLPPVFPKFVSSISGPISEVLLPRDGDTDWEIELVVIIGIAARHSTVLDAWEHIAGVTIGQDISERKSQLSGPAPQFGLSKSHPGFSPIGPWLVTPDELENPDDLQLTCTLDGEVVQSGRSGDLIMSVPRLISELSKIIDLYPGDVIFTGTPDGVGMGRTPPRFLQPGQVLVSKIGGIGYMRQTFV